MKKKIQEFVAKIKHKKAKEIVEETKTKINELPKVTKIGIVLLIFAGLISLYYNALALTLLTIGLIIGGIL